MARAIDINIHKQVQLLGPVKGGASPKANALCNKLSPQSIIKHIEHIAPVTFNFVQQGVQLTSTSPFLASDCLECPIYLGVIYKPVELPFQSVICDRLGEGNCKG